MPKKSASQRAAERRAEARRRARLQAQGRFEDEDQEAADAAPARPPAMPLMQRLFPLAAPLAGKPDPFRGFNPAGPRRRLRETLWLIRQNLIAGIGMGGVWALTVIIAPSLGTSTAGSILSFGSLGALLAAGWLGWQRPWLYGLVAGAAGSLISAPYLVYAVFSAPTSTGASPAPLGIAAALAVYALQYAAIGAAAGFYAGYLRRRLADPATRRQPEPRRRR